MSFFDDAISTLGRDLAQTAVGALSDETGYDIGGTINGLFGKQTTGGENLATLPAEIAKSNLPADAAAELTSSVQQQTAIINALGGKIDAIAAGISQIQGEIANMEVMLKQIDQHQMFQDWNTVNVQIIPTISAIQTSYVMYGNYISNYTTTPVGLVTELATTILDPNDGPLEGASTICSFIKDDAQSKGVLQLWSNMVSSLVAAGLVDPRDAVSQYCDYYKKLAYAQLQATNLVMEAYNFNQDKAQSTLIWTQYREQLLSQEPYFIQWLYPLVAAGISGGAIENDGVLWGWSYGAIDCALQLNAGLQKLPSSPMKAPTAYYEPSSLFEEAEELLSSLYLTEVGQRRIVVHMLYDTFGPIVDAVGGVVSTLDTSSSGVGVTISPSTQNDLGHVQIMAGKTGSRTIDMNYFSNGLHVKRFVFETVAATGLVIPDTGYSLTDLNGKNGLIPIQTYLSYPGGEPQFMQESVLGYTMSVSETSPFAFMNFTAYTVPQITFD